MRQHTSNQGGLFRTCRYSYRKRYFVSCLAQNKDPSAILLNDIMNYPLIYVDEDSSIKDGICLMRNKNIRRLPIKKTGKVTSVLTY
jgi:CBS domain-containing protein